MLPIPNVIYTKCYLYQMLPRQSVLDKMLLYENVLYDTLLIQRQTDRHTDGELSKIYILVG